MDPEGKLYVSGAEQLTPNLQRLTQFACKQAIPILASVDAHPENDPEFEQFPPHCVKGSEGQKKIPETLGRHPLFLENAEVNLSIPLRPQAGLLRYDQIVLEKQAFSLFDNVNAGKILERLGTSEYVVYGVATDYCVKAAVLGLLERGSRVRVVEDAIAAVDKKTGREALQAMKRAGARFVTTAEVIKGEA